MGCLNPIFILNSFNLSNYIKEKKLTSINVFLCNFQKITFLILFSGYTPLHLAASGGNMNISTEILE